MLPTPTPHWASMGALFKEARSFLVMVEVEEGMETRPSAVHLWRGGLDVSRDHEDPGCCLPITDGKVGKKKRLTSAAMADSARRCKIIYPR